MASLGSSVRSTRHDKLLTICIARPEARNAVNASVARGIAAALEQLERDPGLAVGILTGASGDFCAGMDLKEVDRAEELAVREGGFAGLVAARRRKPLVAAVEGWALGGGCELALACDIVIAGEGAKFGLPEVKVGLVAAAGGLFRLPARIPYGTAMEMALTGEPISASRAYELGLVNRLVATGDALAAAISMGERISANAPMAVRVTRQIIEASRDWLATNSFARQGPYVAAVRSSADAAEGRLAFMEKRAPVWRDR